MPQLSQFVEPKEKGFGFGLVTRKANLQEKGLINDLYLPSGLQMNQIC